jgi:hypothetical protein
VRLPANELYLGGLPVRADTVRIEWDGLSGIRINGVPIVAPPVDPEADPGGATKVRSRKRALFSKTSTAYEEALLAGKSVRAATEAALLSWTAEDRALLDGDPAGSEGIVEVRFTGGPREMWVLSSEGDRVPRRFTLADAEKLAAELANALREPAGPTLSVIGYEATFLRDEEEVRAGSAQIQSAEGGGTLIDGPLSERELELFRNRR